MANPKKGSMPDIIRRMKAVQSRNAARSLRSAPVRGKKAKIKHLKGGIQMTGASKKRGGYGAARPNFGKTARRSPIAAIGGR